MKPSHAAVLAAAVMSSIALTLMILFGF